MLLFTVISLVVYTVPLRRDSPYSPHCCLCFLRRPNVHVSGYQHCLFPWNLYNFPVMRIHTNRHKKMHFGGNHIYPWDSLSCNRNHFSGIWIVSQALALMSDQLLYHSQPSFVSLNAAKCPLCQSNQFYGDWFYAYLLPDYFLQRCLDPVWVIWIVIFANIDRFSGVVERKGFLIENMQ